jgi:putative MATE family efflux protein
MNTSEQLGEEKVLKLLMKFSVPAIVGMLVNGLYNVVDRVFIGRGVGPLGIAGVTIDYPIMLVMMAFAMLIGIGATALISIRLGQQKKDEAEHIVGNAMSLLIIISLVMTVIGLIFLNPILKELGASNEVLPYAKNYIRIILLGTVFQSIGFGMNNFIRAEGNPKLAMMTMLIGAITNTILNPIFIFIFHWGINGSAIATVISQAISSVWVLYHFFSGRSTLKIYKKNLKLDKVVVKGIVTIGLAPFALQLAASLLTVILNKSLTIYGGDVAISGMGIINSLAMLILMPIFGINQGAQPIIGYNYGAEKFDKVKEALKIAIAGATIVVTIGFIATRLFPEQLIRMFTSDDKELIDFGVHALKTFLIFLPVIGFQIVGANYFQAVGRPKQAMVLSLSRQVLILIPALLILPKFFQLNGVLMAGPLADLLSSIITGTFLYRELKHLGEKHKNSFIGQFQEES